MCDCNYYTKKTRYICAIITVSLLICIFEMVILVVTENTINPEDIYYDIFKEKPLFNFEISQDYFSNKEEIIFFRYKGRELNTGKIGDVKSFNRILRYKFFYKINERTYIDYINKYSVESGNNCPSNTKQCGILDSNNRKLCLPNDEDCPLNGIAISKRNNEPNYNGWEKITTFDSFDNSAYYIYHTNNNPNGKVITDFKLSHGLPCAKDSEKNWLNYYNNEVDKEYSCKTQINGNIYSDKYTKVTDEGITMRGLYKDNSLYSVPDNTDANAEKIDLYIRNFNEMEKCLDDFVKDLDNEKDYYDSMKTSVIVLCAISWALNLAMLCYIFSVFCCKVQFKSIVFVAPIYGIVCCIVVLGILNKPRLKFECELEGLDYKNIDRKLEDQYLNDNLISTILSSLSLAAYILVLVFNLCLKNIKQEGGSDGAAVAVPQGNNIPVVAQPVLFNNPYNIMFNQNMVSPPGTYGYAPGYGAPPGSNGAPYS